jgi:tight adherence protein C
MQSIPFDLIVTILAGATAVVAAFVIWRGFVYKDPMAARLKTIANRRAELRKRALEQASKVSSNQKKSADLMKSAAKKLKLRDRVDVKSTRSLLAQAGFRGKDAPEVFLMAKLIMPFVLGGLAVLYVVFGGARLSPMLALLACVGGAGLGFLAPGLFVKNRAMKRKLQLKRALPDALDLLVICTEAGLSINQALNRVVDEVGRSSPEIAEELGLLAVELNFLDDRRQAYANLIERTGLDDFKAIVTTVQQAEKYGTPVSKALRVLSAEFRTERLLKAEEKAARLPAILTVPMVLFILPCLFIVLIGPAILRTIDAFSRI